MTTTEILKSAKSAEATIKVATREQAWNIAGEIFPTDYEKDAECSARAGYDIYRHPTLNWFNRICDLGNRLEVLIEKGVINIWIEPEIIKDMGTGMSQADYERLCGKSNEWIMTEEEAIQLVSSEFGFEASKVHIIKEVETFYKDGRYAKLHKKYIRRPQYCATDYNYVRFNVKSVIECQYEMINGELNFYRN
jgi:hypothetical protein